MCMKKHLTKQQVLAYRRRVLKDSEDLGVSETARRYGICRDTIYGWRKEILPQKPGPRGIVYWQTDIETEEFILQIRLGTSYGPKRIKFELSDYGIVVGEKAIRGVIERAGLVKQQRSPKKKAPQPFYAPYPGYRLQVDTKSVPNGGDKRRSRRQQFTAIDIVSKIRYLRVMDGLSNGNSIAFVEEALKFYEDIGIKIECVQTDNHSTFTNLYVGGSKLSDHELRRIHPLTLYLAGRGIEHKLSRPGTPQHNGFVERSHRTDEEEFYSVTNTASMDVPTLDSKMHIWQVEYNELRRHSGCKNLPPLEHFNSFWKPRLSHA
jgi:transposase InsO family protein